jgi:hypothetical protein
MGIRDTSKKRVAIVKPTANHPVKTLANVMVTVSSQNTHMVSSQCELTVSLQKAHDVSSQNTHTVRSHRELTEFFVRLQF